MNLYEPGQQNTRLLAALAEELKLPLTQIVHKSQLARINNDTKQLQDIETTADASLRLIDSYLFTTQVLLGQQRLALEPVAIGATMYDTAQYLQKIATLYDCDIDVQLKAKQSLIMAHPEALRTALISLAYTFITSSEATQNNRVILQAYTNRDRVEAGVISLHKSLQKQSLRKARQLYGLARQSFAPLSHGSGAGVYVADSLFVAMASELHVSKRRGQSGLFAGLQPSQQIALL